MISPKVLLCALSLSLATPLWAKWQPRGDDISMLADEGAAAVEADGKLVDSVAKLKELGIISDSEYWLQNAVKGKSCDGGMVADLIINAAKKFGTADNLQDAVKILVDNKILQDKDTVEYWQTKAVAGKKCPGRFVGIIINQIASTL